ncbi:fungal pheromone STE3G-protein-coupled receptor, partial [Peniophora sp. CONT]
WNLGVAFLCFWLLLENLGQAANAIIWSDNAEIKYYVYCDVVSHLQIVTYIVTPMATLMITRRLYLIASLQSVDLPSKAARRWDSVIEWTLGLFIPLLVADYAHQGCRFEVDEVFGCTNAVRTSILEILTVDSWTVILPLVSISYFYPRVVHILYRQSRDINSFLNSDTSVLRTNYLRILAVASIDILLTLPMGVVSIALRVRSILEEKGSLAFYLGWTCIHINWEPSSIPYAQLKASGIAGIAQLYFLRWSAPVLAYTIFGLFGLTYEARASYGLIGRTVGSWIGRSPAAPAS